MSTRTAVVALLAAVLVLSFRAGARESAPAPAAALVAVCDVDQLMYDLMQNDRYNAEIMKMHKQTSAESKELYDEAMKKYAESERAGDSGPDAEKLQEEYQKAYERYSKRSRELRAQYEKMWMEKYAAAFSEVKQAATRVATDHGYTHLLASVTRDEPLTQSDPGRQNESRKSRRVLMFPEDTDITQDVRDVLRIEYTPIKENSREESEDE